MMMMKPIALLTVVAENRMIGNTDDSPLPFDFDSGLAWILHIESGKDKKEEDAPLLRHNLVYGRRVYEEFAGYGVLPSGGGTNYVVSGSLANPDGSPKALPTVLGDESTIHPKLVAVGSIEQALDLGSQTEEENPRAGELCLVLGGQRVYTESLPRATFLRKYHMRTTFEGGILFPEHAEDEWKPVYKSKPQVEVNKVDGKEVELQVVEYVRKSALDDDPTSLGPVIESIQNCNRIFDLMEELKEE